MVRFLLSHGADPNANLRGAMRSPLECAAYSASVSTIDLLVQTGAKITGRSNLSIAAHEGKIEIMRYLLDHGAENR